MASGLILIAFQRGFKNPAGQMRDTAVSHLHGEFARATTTLEIPRERP